MSRVNILLFTFVIFLVCDESLSQRSRVYNKDKNGDMDKMMGMLKTLQKKSMGKPDPRVGEMVSGMSPDDKRNADEMGTYMEGDMLQTNDFHSGVDPRWTGGIVPYVIEGSFNEQQLVYIKQAMAAIEESTCIQFEERAPTQRDYIAISSTRTGCWSSVGRNGDRQELNLQIPGCVYSSGIAIHELLHALGLPHEQNRRDRDNYVSIAFRNIETQHAHNFQRVKYTGFGVGYDFNSIMHYGKFAFSRNGLQTIFPKDDVSIGQRRGLSSLDVKEINRLYSCDSVKQPSSYKPISSRSGSYGPNPKKKTEFTLQEIFQFLNSNPNTQKWTYKM